MQYIKKNMHASSSSPDTPVKIPLAFLALAGCFAGWLFVSEAFLWEAVLPEAVPTDDFLTAPQTCVQ